MPVSWPFSQWSYQASAAMCRLSHGQVRPYSPSPVADWRSFPPLDLDPPLAAAIDAFVETGYHGSSMRDIAKRAGLSVPGVYHYYAEKPHLLVRALEITMDELHRRVDAARAEAVDGASEVRLIVEALALFHTHRRKLAFIGASEMRSLTPANRDRIARRAMLFSMLSTKQSTVRSPRTIGTRSNPGLSAARSLRCAHRCRSGFARLARQPRSTSRSRMPGSRSRCSAGTQIN
jgi:AcrR family transcriptional regulator